MSHITECKKIKKVVEEEVTTGIKCDFCGKMIPPMQGDCDNTRTPFYHIKTHHYDWGNDSIDSYEEFDACSIECALRKTKVYLIENYETINTQRIEIAHVSGWSLNFEEAAEEE